MGFRGAAPGWLRRLALLVGVVCLVAACSGDEDSAPTPTSTTSASTTTTAFAGSTAAVSIPPGGEARDLKAVRLGTHDGFDRVVFDFDGPVPGYSVKYVDRPIIADASGEEVAVNGVAVLEVRFEPAAAHDATKKSTISAPVLVEVVKTGDFEAVVHYAIGVKKRAAFHAATSESTKLIIDIASG
jgi:hypothetical protein